jgi:hypothetical protein
MKAYISDASLDVADISSMKARLLGEVFLGKS